RVRYPPIDDVSAVNAALDSVQRAANLRQHAAVDGAVGDQAIHLSGGQSGQHLSLLVHQAGDVGQQHQFFRLQRFGDLACHQVRVDVVGLAIRADANRCDDRDEVAANQHFQQLGIDPGDLTYLTDVDDLR